MNITLDLYIEKLREQRWQYNKEWKVLISPLGYFEIILVEPIICRNRFIVDAENIREQSIDANTTANALERIKELLP